MSNSKSRRARDPSSLSNSPHLTHARTHSSATSNHRSVLQKPPVVSAPSPQPSSGMTAVSRYNQNLKVLRRNDPSIVSIIDQFSHVCLYHHNGAKWEKKGYEGSMFLFERFVSFRRSCGALAFRLNTLRLLFSPQQCLSPIWPLYSQSHGHGRLCALYLSRR